MTNKKTSFSSSRKTAAKRKSTHTRQKSRKKSLVSRITDAPFSQKCVWVLCALILIAVIVLILVVADKIETARIQKKMAIMEEYVDAACAEFDLPKALVYAVIKTESDFEPDAESNAGARGLMQLTKIAVDDVNQRLGENYSFSEMFDPEVNIRCGVCYLSYLYNYFKDYETAIAAYNAGIGVVTDWLGNEKYASEGKLTNIPYPETSKYVKKVFQYWEDYKKVYG